MRLQAVIAQLQHHAAHNAPVPQSAIKELQALATAIGQGPAPAMPVIDSVDPATAPEGTINMTVTGQNFSAESVICYGDVNQTTTVVLIYATHGDVRKRPARHLRCQRA